MSPIVIWIATTIGGVILTTVTTACMLHFKKTAKTYKDLLENKKDEDQRKVIREELEPLIEEIHRLQLRIEACEKTEEEHIKAILNSYKFRLVALCRTYMRQGYITPDQFAQLSEFYKVYRELGGNGQAQEYYSVACALPIHEEVEEE